MLEVLSGLPGDLAGYEGNVCDGDSAVEGGEDEDEEDGTA